MEYRRLGRSGLKVSPLCLGTMMFGRWGNADHDDSIRVIHEALDAGVNFVDTANIYSYGESEEIVGKAIKARRQEVVLATKVWGAMGPGPNQKGLSRKAIQEQCEASLRRLQTDVIDLYQVHRPDPETPWEETLSTLTDLVRQGKVRYVGASTNHWEVQGQKVLTAWELVETLWLAERKGFEPFVSLQPPYSLLRRVVESSHFEMTRRFGIGNLVWSPLEGGWLSGKYRKGKPNPSDSPRAEKWMGDTADPKFERRLQAVEKLVALAEAKGVPLADLAVAWTLQNPDVSSVIVGPRTMKQLEGSLNALEVRFTPEEIAAVDAIVPPGGSVL
ncbi:aldo/keto reductase [Acidobacteria bacterium ACD]|nr:MAG: aldo/keto reductase [Acidobacteriota bacterium]MCE7957894.1 aldo/keto reductase [Acidobacteria bacterium ACB2]MDL1949851.1 aldo/keto reductase [Acidobacteria bacterium ACD]